MLCIMLSSHFLNHALRQAAQAAALQESPPEAGGIALNAGMSCMCIVKIIVSNYYMFRLVAKSAQCKPRNGRLRC